MDARWLDGRTTVGRLGMALLTLATLEAPVAASPLSEALARHADADVTALRAHRDDTATRCTLGAIYARRNDLPRAALYLADCEHAALADDVAAALPPIARDVKHRLRDSRYAELAIVSQPEGLTAEIDALPGESFTTPATVWVAPGAHVVHAQRDDRTWTQHITAEPHKNAVVMIETRLDAKPPAPRTTAIDFAQDDASGSLGEEHTGPPPDIKHPSLLQGKYRGVADPASGDPIDDPLAARDAPTRSRQRWLGVRLGAGMFDDGSAAARAGLAVAIAGRLRVTDDAFVALRADGSRRGGAAMTGTLDVLGASAGVGVTVLGTAEASRGLALALIGQLRGDLRLAAMRDAAPVRRIGLSLAAGAELALPATPFTVGLRVEQGVTELVAGARDRAILAELGLDVW
jgi:hypothetical protein